ncbi:hypothetical protein FRB94_001518 [Tulasnella sp. JGI-2019a]|nr:hypothetical protein FRB94_001518 [Tulasnella sp. JGI-2019a]KAG9007025.1 hypothetical protein FRB93_008292 [Tulasnella sp. JGI-2019a]KAG9034223.1 hypothetical protein FRB95_013504 [Tulasnella sp. JGI-2019a]
MPIKATVKEESTSALKIVDDDRKYALQATMVRVLKARKTMHGDALVVEVISQLSGRFTPRQTDFDSAMALLIEKQYMESVEVDGQPMFIYLS